MKKNNKGFSLVELIVVVLIMGIIAVALAPQVMKWVDKSRENTTKSQREALQSAIQVAYADYQAENGKIASGVGVPSGILLNSTTALASVNSGLNAKVMEVLGNEVPTDANNNFFTIMITADGVVEVR
jgi:prepilin-type N-terminal cleavage/methylation domain-containing protein